MGLLSNFTMQNSKGLYPPKMSGNGLKRRSKKRAAVVRRAPRKRNGKAARLVKGSAAAKAYMAKIRRKRRR
jgi:hypothetical protein